MKNEAKKYFRFIWEVFGLDSSGSETESWDIIVCQNRCIVLEGTKITSVLNPEPGYDISGSRSEDRRGNLSFEEACEKFGLPKGMPTLQGGCIKEGSPEHNALSGAGVPNEVRVPCYGGSRFYYLCEE